MLERFYPFTARLAQKLRGHAALDRLAVAREVVHGREASAIPGIEMDEDQRAKVIGAQEDSTLEAEWARVAGRPEAMHDATVIYEFRNVLATPNGLFTLLGSPSASGRPGFGELARAPIARRASGFYPLPGYAIRYFGHWLLDGLPTVALRNAGDDLYLPIPTSWSHARAYARILGIDPIADEFVHFDRLRFRPRQEREPPQPHAGPAGGASGAGRW